MNASQHNQSAARHEEESGRTRRDGFSPVLETRDADAGSSDEVLYAFTHQFGAAIDQPGVELDQRGAGGDFFMRVGS